MRLSELSQMISLAQRLIDADEPGALATLFAATGSTYRPLGSMMVSGLPTMIAGGVSGGCLEQYIARLGAALGRRQPASLINFDTRAEGDDDDRPILGCGGRIEVLLERLSPEHVTFLRRMHSACELDVQTAAACIVDASIPSELSVSRRWISAPDTDDASPLHSLAMQSLHEHRSLSADVDGARRALIHFIAPLTRLIIIGAGDDARPLCTLAKSLGWHVTVADRRARQATTARFPDADAILAGEWHTVLDAVHYTPRTAVVLMTHSVPDDVEILPLIAEKPAFYIGMLGPERRRDWILQEIASQISSPDVLAARVRGPIGLDLGDRSAPGIALAVAAEITACLNERTASPLSSAGMPLFSAAAPDRSMMRG